MSTITGTVTHRITIGHGGYTSPLTIAAGATVSSSEGDAIRSESLATVIDFGTVLGGIRLAAGYVSIGRSGYVEGHNGVAIDKGEITNRGTIEPTGYSGRGVGLGNGGTLLNSGTIASHGVYGWGATVINKGRGEISGGVVLGGGALKNLSMHGHAPVISGPDGVFVLDGAGFITNSGTIEGITAGGRSGVYLSAGGSVDNSGLIQGQDGVDFYRSAAGTVTNRGTIVGIGKEGFGIYSYDAAVAVDNLAGGMIEGGNDGIFIGAAADATNAGTIIGMEEAGIQLLDGGRVDNSSSAALCLGYLSGVYVRYRGGRIINRGTIEATGTSGVGIELKAGGTIVDSGTISGHTAIYLGGTGSNRVKLDPGASISGSVVAEGTANLIELASGAAAGTISGLGTNIIGFDEITVDAGAAWRLSGEDSGITVTNNGTISVENGDTLLLGGLAATGRFDIGGSATVEFTGTVAAGQDFVFTDRTGFLGLYDPAAFLATVDGFRSGDVIDLFGETATRLAFKAGVLKVFDDKTLIGTLQLSGRYTTSAFQLTSDGRGGTDITLKSSAVTGVFRGLGAAIGADPPDFWTQPQS